MYNDQTYLKLKDHNILKKLIAAYALIAIVIVWLIMLLVSTIVMETHTDQYGNTWLAPANDINDGVFLGWIGIMIVFVVVGVIYVIRSRR